MPGIPNVNVNASGRGLRAWAQAWAWAGRSSCLGSASLPLRLGSASELFPLSWSLFPVIARPGRCVRACGRRELGARRSVLSAQRCCGARGCTLRPGTMTMTRAMCGGGSSTISTPKIEEREDMMLGYGYCVRFRFVGFVIGVSATVFPDDSELDTPSVSLSLSLGRAASGP